MSNKYIKIQPAPKQPFNTETKNYQNGIEPQEKENKKEKSRLEFSDLGQLKIFLLANSCLLISLLTM